MNAPRFTNLVLKPTLLCTAKCETCSTRKALHDVKRKEDLLGNDYWKKLFQEINNLGVHSLTLSGGEPTLYKPLLELISEGKKYGWEIGMNTNGSLITEEYANRLLDAGLGSVTISIYGSDREFHDFLRGHKGLWQKAINALRIFTHLREGKDPDFQVNMQTLICKDNYRKFLGVIKLAYDMKVNAVAFSYLEGDYTEKKYLLDEFQIMDFKETVIPEVIDIIKELAPNKQARDEAISSVRSIYPLDNLSLTDYASGIYRLPEPCNIPSYFSIILANGDVHPCNIVEYTHEPVVGNLHDDTFSSMWKGQVWRDFRENGFEMCKYCPVPCQIRIPIMDRTYLPFVRSLFKNAPLKLIKPYVRKFIHKRPGLFKKIGLYPK